MSEKANLSRHLRRILSQGPSTIPELHAECPDLTIRRLQIAVWVLISEKQAEKVGRIPEGGRRGATGHNIYALTGKGIKMRRLDLRSKKPKTVATTRKTEAA